MFRHLGALAMATRVRSRGSIGHYARPDALVVAARKLGMRRGSVEQLCYGRDNCFRRSAVIIEALVRSDQSLRAERLLMPIEVARVALPTPPITGELRDDNKKIEQAEDRAEVRYERDPSDENARAWHAELRAEAAHNIRVMRALEARHEI